MNIRNPPSLALTEVGAVLGDETSRYMLNPAPVLVVDEAADPGGSGSLLDPLDSLPDASAAFRGVTALVLADDGADDSLRICLRLADGSYVWVPLMTGEE